MNYRERRQTGQDLAALDFMRERLNDTGLCSCKTADIGQAVGVSQPTGFRVLKRLQRLRRVWTVNSPVANRYGNNGRQERYSVFPWRDAPRNVDTIGLKQHFGQTGRADEYISITHIPDIPIVCDSGSYRTGFIDSQWSMYSSARELAVPPAWALTAQSTLAQARLGELNIRLTRLKDQYGEKDWATPIMTTEAQIAETQAYLADLNVWKTVVGVQ